MLEIFFSIIRTFQAFHNVRTSRQAQVEVEHRLLLDVVANEGATILKLMATKD
jgi:hypothetical protein